MKLPRQVKAVIRYAEYREQVDANGSVSPSDVCCPGSQHCYGWCTTLGCMGACI